MVRAMPLSLTFHVTCNRHRGQPRRSIPRARPMPLGCNTLESRRRNLLGSESRGKNETMRGPARSCSGLSSAEEECVATYAESDEAANKHASASTPPLYVGLTDFLHPAAPQPTVEGHPTKDELRD